jgi:DNA-nicking Smr family endonuclease
MSGRRLTAEERRLWRFAVRDAVPLPGHDLPPEPEPPPPPPEPVPARPQAPPPPKPAPKAAPPPPELGLLNNMDHRTADRLRRGRFVIDAHLDLHGLTQAQAHAMLASLVHRCWMEGRRCLLVITGKGYSSGGGVLKQNVPRWLAEPALARMVLAIQPAQPKDGGEGALYILIRRRREER